MTENILETFIKHQDTGGMLENYTDGTVTPALVAPPGHKIMSLEDYMEAPTRTRVEKHFDDLRGFVDYVNDFKQENTVIFCKRNKLACYFDYHTAESPKWNEHSAHYELDRSNRWASWERNNNQWMSQREFCDFLEGGVDEVISPTQTEILDLTKNFRATAKMEVVSDISQGNKISFTGETRGQAAKSDVELPEYIEIAIAPFNGLQAINARLVEQEKFGLYSMKARFVFRLDDKSVSFKYVLVGLDDAMDKATEGLRTAIANLTKAKVYIG